MLSKPPLSTIPGSCWLTAGWCCLLSSQFLQDNIYGHSGSVAYAVRTRRWLLSVVTELRPETDSLRVSSSGFRFRFRASLWLLTCGCVPPFLPNFVNSRITFTNPKTQNTIIVYFCSNFMETGFQLARESQSANWPRKQEQQ